MKKICFFSIVLGITLFGINNSYSASGNEYKLKEKHKEIIITGFKQYYPFGDFVNKENEPSYLKSVFRPIIEDMTSANNWSTMYVQYDDYDKQILEVRRGNIDIIYGAYHDTKDYEGIELIYPAAIINPITVFMLPQRINEVKSTEDLQKLKGVRLENERYSSFVEEQLQNYNIESVKKPYDLFERLFTQKADYILVSQYYGLIEASKLGLRHQISVARQTLWQIPMFIGVSKLSKYRKMLVQKITNHLNIPANTEAIKQRVIRAVEDAEIASQGTVPPTFGIGQTQ